MCFLDKPWKYINEGNVHIVVQVVGTDYVLRLIKEDDKSMNFKSVQDSVNFVNLVMIPLLSSDICDLLAIIELSASDLSNLHSKLSQFRPEHRRLKSVVSSYAIKVSNLTILNPKHGTNYCLEIKPKEGFLSSMFKKHSKCYYCLKQFLKLQGKQIEKTSNYCPLDLFSGNKERMKLALFNLVCNPQNNFKLFKDGNIIYDEKSNINEFDGIIKNMMIFEHTIDAFNLILDFIVEIFLNKSDKSNIILQESKKVSVPTEKPLCIEGNNLENSTLLYKILHLQKLSETLHFDIGKGDENLDYVSLMIDQFKYNKLDLSLEEDRNRFFKTTDPKNLALISAVVKDCSIMISFSSDYVEGLPTIQIGERRIPFKVAVTDLEPKPAKTLIKRKRTENKLIDIYEKMINSSNEETIIQPHIETRSKQIEAWQQLIAEYMRGTKQSTIDIRESQNSPLFNNTSINRKLSQESILTVLEDMARSGKAAPIDKSKNVWEVYWHSLDEWGNMVYSWACNNGLNNSVCTLFELREGENTADEEFHGLDMNILLKALKSLESRGKCELMQFDDNQGVKFF